MVRTAASLPRARVQSLVGELKSHKLRGTAKKKKRVQKRQYVRSFPALGFYKCMVRREVFLLNLKTVPVLNGF